MGGVEELTALELLDRYADGSLSPVEVVHGCLDRIDRYGDEVGAFVTVTADRALAAASEAEQRYAEARRAGEDALARLRRETPLLGVPVPVKDLNLTAGVRTTFGSAVFRDYVPDVDDAVVTHLRDAGAVLVGKTNTPELGLPAYCENAVAPPARTPWDRSRTAGGSSGGAAAAVAARLVPVAHGNDGGGSLRIPAACCGLVGLKPSRGRVSPGPVRGDVTGLPAEGAVARTVADAALVLDVLSRPVVGDPAPAAPLPPGALLDATRRDPPRLRLGRYATPVVGRTEVHPDCLTAYEAATDLLRDLGHEVHDVDAPFTPDEVPAFERVWFVGATMAPVPPHREDELQPLTRWLRARGREVSGTEHALALAAMQATARAALVQLAPYDAVLTPTLAAPPPPVGHFAAMDPPDDFEAQKRWTPFTATYNVTGQPALSLPLHSVDALPVGVMLAGRRGEDALLLALAAQVERAVGWAARRPPLG